MKAQVKLADGTVRTSDEDWLNVGPAGFIDRGQHDPDRPRKQRSVAFPMAYRALDGLYAEVSDQHSNRRPSVNPEGCASHESSGATLVPNDVGAGWRMEARLRSSREGNLY